MMNREQLYQEAEPAHEDLQLDAERLIHQSLQSMKLNEINY
jgi:hypothetical protein